MKVRATIEGVIQFIVYNPVRKIVAIIFAFGLWFFVALGNRYQYRKDITVVYTNIADSLILVDSVPTLTVTFNGRGSALLSTWAASPKAICNLRFTEIGETTISTRSLAIGTGFGDITINHTVPEIRVALDRKISENIDVLVPVKGAVSNAFAVSDVSVLDTVTATGPAMQFPGINAIIAETLNLNNERSSFEKRVRLTTPSPLFVLSRDIIRVAVTVDTAVEKSFTNIPLTLIFTPQQRVVSEKISLDTLVVRGPKDKVERLMKKDITVRIRLSQVEPGAYDFPATIVLPDYITPVSSQPQRFKVTIY
jgi:YbbR domain-containing protein